ncbi:MAG: hypothetical protein RL630_2344 [Verrucomicrobiota bacterium]|jgi:type I restriction enzyme S subunit
MKGWKTSPLGEVVSIVGGGTPTRSNPDFYGGSIPWVTPKDMKSWEITGAQIALTQAGVDNSSTRVVPQNSILIVVRSGVLKHTVPVGLNRVPVAINQDMKALQCGDPVDADFLARFIKAQSPVILKWVRATTADNFPIDKLKKLPVPLPPLAEQRRIAEVLDKVEDLRAKRRAAIAQVDSLTQSLFLDLFGDPVANPKGWPVRSFEETMRDETSRSKKLNQSEFSESGKFPVIDQGQSTIAGYCDDDLMLCVSTLPVVVFGDHTKAVKLVSHPFVVGADGAKVLVSESGIEAVFLATLLRMLPIPDLGYSRHMKELKRLKYITPPLDLQREFARRMAAVEKLKTAQRAALAELDALFASLQHRAFRGEL